MPKVRVLPEVLAHQIAAGEIVERPASVVKELVENAIDAGARSIRVYLEDGGKRLIRVTDDGCGMGSEDAVLAFEHHATSKIEQLEDLRRIQTLGFRGEALPSIASISRVRLRTVEHIPESSVPGSGTEITYEAGRRGELLEIAWPRGTEIVVEDLFFNVPARRKFLKAPSTELSHASRLVMCYALAFPGIEFRLDHESRSLIEASPVETLGDRVFQIFGESLTSALVPFRQASGDLSVSGFASLPHEQRSNGNSLFLFVNRRMVRDRLLTHAIRQSYRDLIPSQAYPVVILFVEIDPEQVDVNVHPTKVEIRFRESQAIYSAILKGIEQGLLHHRSDLSSLAKELSFNRAGSEQAGVARALEAFLSRTARPGLFGNSPSVFPAPAPGLQTGTSALDDASSYRSTDAHGDCIPETAHLSATPVILGQFVESFVVAADRDGVMLIDQHVAHERILYDRALRGMCPDRQLAVQRLLVPEVLELDPQQKSLAGSIFGLLNQNGFEVEWFGDKTLLIRGVPALAGKLEPSRLVEELLDDLERLGDLPNQATDSRGVQRFRESIAISLSCRAAIKINTPLSPEKLQWLVDELFRSENPYTCPHGRPIVVRLDLLEILKAFKRV